MKFRKVIGALILILVACAIFATVAIERGIKDTIIGFGIAAILVVLIVIGTFLLHE